MALIVVTGSPGCGKSTWVRTVAKPGDIRFDGDALTNVLTGKKPAKHHHDSTHKKISRAAREAGIAEAIKHSKDLDVYVLVSNLDREGEAHWRRHGARFVIIDPGEDVAMQRCKDNRPGYKQRLVNAWYARRDQWPRDAEVVRDFVVAGSAVLDDEPEVPTSVRAQLEVVTGPPAAGKSTFVRKHRADGDVTIDYDELANALAGLEPANHEHADHIKAVTKAARQAAIDSALKQAGSHKVWLIHSSPAESTLDKYRAMGATVHVVDPGKDVVMRRVKQERPKHLLRIAAAWYDRQKPTKGKAGTTERGYGWHSHQKPRERLLALHRDGSKCFWCELPMFRDKRKNWDGKSLAADHPEESGAKRQEPPTRLMHYTCNSQAQNHERDHLRPAVTGRHPSEGLPPESSGEAPVRDWGSLL